MPILIIQLVQVIIFQKTILPGVILFLCSITAYQLAYLIGLRISLWLSILRYKESEGECCVWMLDPFKLNKIETGKAQLQNPEDLKFNYSTDQSKNNPVAVMAISPLRHQPRVFHQRSGFTVHRDYDTPLEQLHPEALKKIIIPLEAHEGARNFLWLSGISEFSIFPDLDGLAREINREHFGM